MSRAGDADLLVAARSALLDALDALADQRDALVVIGAQAIYLHTGAVDIALAEATKDSDVAIDPRILRSEPLIEQAMARGGFHLNLADPQPGSWISARGVPVDLMVPAVLGGQGGRRGARIPPHDRHATRRAKGLEAALVDNAPMVIEALDPTDGRQTAVAVAGAGALLVAKLHKLAERRAQPQRLNNNDAHDVYRLLVATDTPTARNAARRALERWGVRAGDAGSTWLPRGVLCESQRARCRHGRGSGAAGRRSVRRQRLRDRAGRRSSCRARSVSAS